MMLAGWGLKRVGSLDFGIFLLSQKQEKCAIMCNLLLRFDFYRLVSNDSPLWAFWFAARRKKYDLQLPTGIPAFHRWKSLWNEGTQMVVVLLQLNKLPMYVWNCLSGSIVRVEDHSPSGSCPKPKYAGGGRGQRRRARVSSNCKSSKSGGIHDGVISARTVRGVLQRKRVIDVKLRWTDYDVVAAVKMSRIIKQICVATLKGLQTRNLRHQNLGKFMLSVGIRKKCVRKIKF